MTERLRSPVATVVALLLLAGAIAFNVAGVRRDLNVPGRPSLTDDRQAMVDFRDTVYWPVRDLASGHDPYDPHGYLDRRPVAQELDLYAPGQLLLHAPFALPPYETAEWVWFCVVVALVVAFGAVVLRAAGLPVLPSTVAALGAVLLVTEPGQASVYLGQLDPEIILGCALALVWAGRRPNVAAAGLALALTKPQFGVPLGLLLLARGLKRDVLRSVALAAAVSLPVVVLLVRAAGGVGAFADHLRANVDYALQTPYGDLASPSGVRTDPLALVGRLLGARAPGAVQVLLAIVVLGVTAWLARGLDDDDPLLLALLSLAVLVAVVHAPADALLLALPFGAIAVRRWRDPAYAVLLALLAAPFLYATRAERWVESATRSQVWAGAVTGLAVTAALLLAWMLALRTRRNAAGNVL
ncbi:MAG: hypothetical protein QOE45_439 [Frankiaceae bacterium]|jgi:hypothetical protein|nr:hypothetical protein [Frankiaceae bacterium]